MSGEVIDFYVMGTSNISASIIREANERYHKRVEENLQKHLQKKYSEASNIILENLPSINGLPLNIFLNRMIGVTPMFRHGTMALDTLLTELVSRLSETLTNNNPQNLGTKYTHEDKIQALRNLCQIAANTEDRESFGRWLSSKAYLLNEGVANCLGTEYRDLTQEACFAIAYLARIYRFKIYDRLDLVIAALVRSLALVLIPWENNVEQYRDAKERHNDLELARGRSIIFHYPRMEYSFIEANHRVIGCIYYTLGDLLFSCPSPKLIHFFECRIFRRKEMTRNILFTILHVVVLNLSELQQEAESLASEGAQSANMDAASGRALSPLTSRKGRIYNEAMWNEIAANLYSDIIRVYNDRNRANKIMINEIMVMLRAHAPEKLPIFEEATLKALELYAGGGGGRLAETYQIGRQTGAVRDNEGSSKRRKSVTTQPLAISSGMQSSVDKTGISSDVAGKTRKSNATSFDLFGVEMGRGSVLEQADKASDQEISYSQSSSEMNTYSSDSTRLAVELHRRTIIPPKIPDLISPSRIRKKR